MSAYVSLIGEEAAYLFTDGASYDKHGIVQAFVCKTSACPTVPLALTTLGSTFIGDHVSEFLVAEAEKHGVDFFFETFLPMFLDEMKRKRILFTTEDGSGATCVHIVAWSKTRGFMHGNFQTADEAASGIEDAVNAFEFKWVTGNINARGPLPDQGMLKDVPPLAGAKTEENVMRHVGVSCMEMMRQVKGRSMHAKGDESVADHYAVGGHIDMTIITPTGTERKRIKVWDDKVGQLIQPKVKRDTVTDFPGMNRQQRRAAERQQRNRVA